MICLVVTMCVVVTWEGSSRHQISRSDQILTNSVIAVDFRYPSQGWGTLESLLKAATASGPRASKDFKGRLPEPGDRLDHNRYGIQKMLMGSKMNTFHSYNMCIILFNVSPKPNC